MHNINWDSIGAILLALSEPVFFLSSGRYKEIMTKGFKISLFSMSVAISIATIYFWGSEFTAWILFFMIFAFPTGSIALFEILRLKARKRAERAA